MQLKSEAFASDLADGQSRYLLGSALQKVAQLLVNNLLI